MLEEGTSQPAALAARRAMSCQPVTLRSLSSLVGWYRQPPALSRFLGRICAERISLTARTRAARIDREIGVGGHADGFGQHQGADAVAVHRAVARLRDQQAIWLLVGQHVADPLSMASMEGPGSPGTWPAARNDMTASDVIDVAGPNVPDTHCAIGLSCAFEMLETR